MPKTLFTAKPQKVYAEQFLAAASPPAAGVCTCGLSPTVANGPPHVHAAGLVWPLQNTDWIISDRFTQEPREVLTDAQFDEVYGKGQLAEGGTS